MSNQTGGKHEILGEVESSKTNPAELLAQVLSIFKTKVPDRVQQSRIKVCESCEHFRPRLRQCAVCKCFMDTKTSMLYDPVESAAQMKTVQTKCPKSKW